MYKILMFFSLKKSQTQIYSNSGILPLVCFMHKKTTTACSFSKCPNRFKTFDTKSANLYGYFAT